MQEVTRRRPKPNQGPPLPQMTLLITYATPAASHTAFVDFGSVPCLTIKSQRLPLRSPRHVLIPARARQTTRSSTSQRPKPNPMATTRALLLTTTAAALLLLLAGGGGAAAARGPLAGGWSPIRNVSEPHIQELGGWAVTEHVRVANDGLRFGEVTSGEQQVVSGMNYRLVLHATDADGDVAAYGALVYEQSWTNTRELMSFASAN